MDLKKLLEGADPQHLTDIHLSPGVVPIVRVDGTLTKVEGEPELTEEEIQRICHEIADEFHFNELETVGETDFAVTYKKTVRMRCNIYRTSGQTAMALRLLPMRVPTAQELNIPRVLIAQAEKPRGLILITGPTGSGKSSTLAALIDHINHTATKHIITLENPIEYIHTNDKCVIHQRDVGEDTESFANGLRAALRQDPDVILVGEMRDLDTISTAITAAETGHLVFGTLHTKGAANTIDRIVDVFPAQQQDIVRVQLADILECAIGQTILPAVGGGRRAVFEIMTGTSAIRSLIRQNKSFQLESTMQTSRREGMVLLDDALVQMVERGLIYKNDASYAANDRDKILKAREPAGLPKR